MLLIHLLQFCSVDFFMKVLGSLSLSALFFPLSLSLPFSFLPKSDQTTNKHTNKAPQVCWLTILLLPHAFGDLEAQT